MKLLKAENLVKEYPGVTAVNGVSFGINGGEIFGFLGPNGAGKTTTINMLTGLARITSGAVFLDGKEYTHNLKSAQRSMGIDVVSAGQVRRLILDLNENGTTIFLTTHYIEEAERLCHRIAFIVDGKVVRIGALDELMREMQQENILQITMQRCDETLLQRMRERFPDYTVEIPDRRHGREYGQSGSHMITVSSQSAIDLMPLIEFLHANGTSVFEAKLVRPSLEEVFVSVTGIDTQIMRIDREGRKK